MSVVLSVVKLTSPLLNIRAALMKRGDWLRNWMHWLLVFGFSKGSNFGWLRTTSDIYIRASSQVFVGLRDVRRELKNWNYWLFSGICFDWRNLVTVCEALLFDRSGGGVGTQTFGVGGLSPIRHFEEFPALTVLQAANYREISSMLLFFF